MLPEFRLVLEGVHLRHAALHEEEDAAFGLGRKVLRFGSERIGRRRRAGILLQEVQQRYARQTKPGIEKEPSTGKHNYSVYKNSLEASRTRHNDARSPL